MSKKKMLEKKLILERRQRTLLVRVSDVGSLGASTIDDLHTMFLAISNAAKEDSAAYNLAHIGSFLADEYSQMVEAAGAAAAAEMENLLMEASS